MLFSSLLPSQSMAARCSSCNISSITKVNRSVTGAVMANKSIQEPKKVQTCLYKPSLSIKVFEDKAKGIICYRDEKGEMICEGYDEGPRYSPQPSKVIYNRHVCKEIQNSSYRQERSLQILKQQNRHCNIY